MGAGIWFWVEMILALLVGILAAANLIVAKQPNAAATIAKLVPYQAIIGLVAIVVSVIFLIDVLSVIGILFRVGFILALLYLIVPILAILLGLLFGWSMISQKTGAKSAAVENAVGRIGGVQAQLGVAEIIATLLLVIFFIFKITI